MEVSVSQCVQNTSFFDIGSLTIEAYRATIREAGTLFVNGPAGVFEDPRWEIGTRELWRAVARAPGYTVVGGGDSVSALTRFSDPAMVDYVCSAGGAMVRYVSGKTLPLVAAMEGTVRKDGGG